MTGSYTVEVNTWRPIGNGPGPEMRRFFIGGSPELEDPTYPQKPAMADVRSLFNNTKFPLVHCTLGSSGYLVTNVLSTHFYLFMFLYL